MTTETIYGQIVAKANNYLAVPDGNGARRIIKSDIVRAYERTFASQCTIYCGVGISTPFRLYALIWQRSKQYDLDNSIKTLLDCLQSVGAITDGNLCMEIVARKGIDRVNPRVEFAIEEINKQLSLFDLRELYLQARGQNNINKTRK